MFDDYTKAHEYFYGKKNHYWDLGLDNIRSFLKELGSPENKLNIVQVAGTNGKGSVSAFLANILIESGYKTGRYNSPAVFEERENITINNEPVSKEKFIQQVNCLYDVMERTESEGRLPTIFELETIMAINYFYMEGCDIVILEAGLGGENDATNVSEKNILSVITSVSLDHMKYLGDTVKEIARVKSGIIKKDGMTAAGINNSDVTDIIKDKAKEENGIFVNVRKEDITIKNSSLNGQTFSYVMSDKEIMSDIRISLLGNNQAENASTAIEAACLLKRKFKKVTNDTIRRGLLNTEWKGRFQVVSENPVIILDGAHNPDAALRLRENIEGYLKEYNIVFVIGVFADKDYRSIISIMEPYMERVITVTADSARALPSEDIKSAIDEISACTQKKMYVSCACDYREAVSMAMETAQDYTAENGKETAIVAFGSLSYLKYLLEEIKNVNRQ